MRWVHVCTSILMNVKVENDIDVDVISESFLVVSWSLLAGARANSWQDKATAACFGNDDARRVHICFATNARRSDDVVVVLRSLFVGFSNCVVTNLEQRLQKRNDNDEQASEREGESEQERAKNTRERKSSKKASEKQRNWKRKVNNFNNKIQYGDWLLLLLLILLFFFYYMILCSHTHTHTHTREVECARYYTTHFLLLLLLLLLFFLFVRICNVIIIITNNFITIIIIIDGGGGGGGGGLLRIKINAAVTGFTSSAATANACAVPMIMKMTARQQCWRWTR